MGAPFAVAPLSELGSQWGSPLLHTSVTALTWDPPRAVASLVRAVSCKGLLRTQELSLLGDYFNRNFPFQILKVLANTEIKSLRGNATSGVGSPGAFSSEALRGRAVLGQHGTHRTGKHRAQISANPLLLLAAEHTACTRTREDSPNLDGRIFRVCYTFQTCSYLHDIQSKSLLKMDKYFLNNF